MALSDAALQIAENLPEIISFAYAVSFLLLMWVYGNIAVKSIDRKMHFSTRYALSFGIGFLILFCASALENVFSPFSGGIYDLLNINFVINGVIATIVFSAAFYMISRQPKKKDDKKIIEELNEKIRKMKELLEKNKIMLVSEDDAKRKAVKLVSGFSVKAAVLRHGKWNIHMENLDKQKADVFIDPYDGSYEIAKDEKRIPALKLAGVVLIIAILAFSAINFKGFPQSDFSSIAEDLGISQEEFDIMFGEKNLPEGCVKAMTIAAKYGMKMASLDVIEDNETRRIIEEGSGQRVVIMYRAPHEGKNYTMAVAFPRDFDLESAESSEVSKNTNICVALGDKFCDCLK